MTERFWTGLRGLTGLGGGFGVGGGDHGVGARGGIGDEFFDELRFGQVGPVAAGHFAEHGVYFEAGGVEDAAVVGAPERFEGIGGRGGIAGDAGRFVQGEAVPVDAAARGEDGPVHRGETALEERGAEGDDVVFGFVPGDVVVAAVVGAHEAEADEGGEFMEFAADGFFPRAQGVDVGVGEEVEEVFFAVSEAPEDAVKDFPAIRGGVGGDEAGVGGEFAGDAEGAGSVRGRR